ncbi:hypothetical protein Bbelb_125080 [Branchiostoma belcheri]|nr:hypothetical protein Bbelb_125080 [Branchiostoma belcheri]
MNSGRGSSQDQSSPKGQGFGGKEIPALRIQPETPCPPSNNATPVPVSVPNGTPTEKERNFSLPALPLHHKPLQKHNSRPFPNPSGPTRITTDNVHLKGKKGCRKSPVFARQLYVAEIGTVIVVECSTGMSPHPTQHLLILMTNTRAIKV